MTSFSKQQGAAIKKVLEWVHDPDAPQVFRLFGLAGTGKTFCSKHVASEIDGNVLFAAYTGKAALVMRSKGCTDASTIHSLIYKPEINVITGEVNFKLNADSELTRADLLIVDECSMVDEALAQDLLSFNVKVLVLGDPFQLPPVKGAGFFINAKPDVMLTEIRRQEAENPIIRMSIDIREGKKLQLGSYGNSSVISRSSLQTNDVLAADQVIVGLNNTRHVYNRRIRELLDIDSPFPVDGDRLICLKNNKEKGFLNGSQWLVTKTVTLTNCVDSDVISLDGLSRDAPSRISVLKEYYAAKDEAIKALPWKLKRFFDEFTYSYAITCHKSQGSQWDRVMVFDESSVFAENAAKWLYTAITRAAESVVVVQS